MRFALLGDHPDGLDMARALVESGRHELAVYCGPAAGMEYLRRWNVGCKRVGDMEEVLADPAIDAVIVAGRAVDRPDQLRRALQSERHVLCVQPFDTTLDAAYEAALIQGDTRQVLLPLLPEGFHPAIDRLAGLVRSASAGLGAVRLIEMERWSAELFGVPRPAGKKQKPALPGWDVLRVLGGEIAEVFAFASREELDPQEPLLLAGRFERGGLFQAAFLSGQPEAYWRLSAIGSYGRADLVWALGWPGPAHLAWRDEAGKVHEQTYPTWNPWPALVEEFEQAVAAGAGTPGRGEVGTWSPGQPASTDITRAPLPQLAVASKQLTWQDAVRQLELDDAARRSVERRRASALDYQEASEEAGFKGTMTLFGCGLLWGSLLLLILSRWVPWAGWLIAPLFGLFLVMQVLRWVARKPNGERS